MHGTEDDRGTTGPMSVYTVSGRKRYERFHPVKVRIISDRTE